MENSLPLILSIVSILIGVVSLIIAIWVLIKIFTNSGALLGILGIVTCCIFVFIFGWIKNKEWKITKLMLIWTACIVINIVITSIIGGQQGFFVSKNTIDQLISSAPKAQSAPAAPINKPIIKPISRPETTTPGQPATASTTPAATTPAPATPGATTTASGTTLIPIPGKAPTAEAAPDSSKTVDYDLELKNLENLIKLNDKNADAFYNRGYIYQYKGELQLAENDYTKSIELNPKNEDAYYNRALIYVKNQNFELALKDFSEAIKIRPSASDAYCNRGNVYFEMGKIDMALTDYNEAVKLSPLDGDLYYNQGLAFLKQNNKEKAMNAFHTAAGLGHALAKKYLTSSTSQ